MNTFSMTNNQAQFATTEGAIGGIPAISDDTPQHAGQQGRMRVWAPLLCAAAVLHTALIFVA